MFVPSGGYLIEMGTKRSLTFLFLSYFTSKDFSGIFSEDLINHHQFYLVWEVSLVDEFKDVKLQV